MIGVSLAVAMGAGTMITGAVEAAGSDLVFRTTVFDAVRRRLLPAPEAVASPRSEPLRSLAELSDGNPFHVEELIRSTGGDVLSANVAIPRTVEHSVTSRLATLDPATRRAAARAAIIGRDVPIDQLAVLMECDGAQTAELAAELVSAGLVVEDLYADVAGEPFDPELHEAISVQPSDEVEPGSVVTVVQKGYTLNGRLLRPAMVIVAAE